MKGAFMDKTDMKIDTNKGLLYEYTNILTGQNVSFPAAYFTKGSNGKNETSAIAVFKYAFEIFLHWTPIDAKNMLNWDIIKKMSLDRVIGYLNVPAGVKMNEDFAYIVHVIYPEVVPYNENKFTSKVYESVLKGKDEYGNGISKFPKKFFDNSEGVQRACVCLRHMIEHYMLFTDGVHEMYEYFSTPDAVKAIDQYKLKLVLKDVFLGAPVRYLHLSLPDQDKDEFDYHFYSFLYEYDRAKRKYYSNKKSCE